MDNDAYSSVSRNRTESTASVSLMMFYALFILMIVIVPKTNLKYA